MGKTILLVYQEKDLSHAAGGIKAVKKAFKRVKDVSVKAYSDDKIQEKEKKVKYWKAIIFMKGDDVDGLMKDIKDCMEGKSRSKVLVVTETTQDAVIDSSDQVPGTDYILKTKSLDDITNWWPRTLNFLFGSTNDPLIKPMEQKKRCMFLFNGNPAQHDEEEFDWYKKISGSLKMFGATCVWQGDKEFEVVRTTNPQSVYQIILARDDGQGMIDQNCRILGKHGKMLVFTDNKRSEVCKYLDSLKGAKSVTIFTIKDKAEFGYTNWIHLLSGLDLIKLELSTAVPRETWILLAVILVIVLIVLPFFIGLILLKVCLGVDVFQCFEPCTKSDAASYLVDEYFSKWLGPENIVVPAAILALEEECQQTVETAVVVQPVAEAYMAQAQAQA